MTFIKTSKTYSNDLAKRTPPIVTNIVNKQGYHAKTGNPPSQKLPTSSSLYLHSSHRREMPSHLSHPLAKTYYYSVINQVFLPTSASQTHTHTHTHRARNYRRSHGRSRVMHEAPRKFFRAAAPPSTDNRFSSVGIYEPSRCRLREREVFVRACVSARWFRPRCRVIFTCFLFCAT